MENAEEEIKLIINSAIGIILFGIVSSAIITSAQTQAEPLTSVNYSWACTADVETCPDGSTVTRVPPYCKFAKCPDEDGLLDDDDRSQRRRHGVPLVGSRCGARGTQDLTLHTLQIRVRSNRNAPFSSIIS